MEKTANVRRFLLAIVLLIQAAALGAAAWLATSLPLTGLDKTTSGVGKPVEIIRDENSVAHIFAETDTDAYFALGVAHAQDRFWQMEMMRRLGAGRLAEVLGPAVVDSDKWMRLLGLYKLAEDMVKDLPAPVRKSLEAYAQGVNFWLEEDIGLVAPEFAVFRYRPEPWKLADSLVWGKIMAARLGGNWRGEALRARLAGKLTPERVRELWPAYPRDGLVTIAGLSERQTQDVFAGISEIPTSPLLRPVGSPKGASNAWAVAADQTESGGAILANDPHLGFSAPILWYLARVETPWLRVTGATVPGVPFTILGHSKRIAWGMTTTQSDSEDLFVEKLDANEPERYVTPAGSKPFYQRKEVIKVRGGADITFIARSTDHGPVISDLRPATAALAGKSHVISLSAVYLRPNDRSAVAFYAINRATSWESFKIALLDYKGPQQNFMYADTAGHIGFIAAGRVPKRGLGQGYVPTAGWNGETDWTGYLAFDELPQTADPPAKRLINANNRIVGDDYTHFLGHDWAPPFRAERIAGLLDDGKGNSVRDVLTMQRDITSNMVKTLLPVMLAAKPAAAPARKAATMLAKWDGAMAGGRAEPLIFSAWLLALNRALYGDELGADTPSYLGARPMAVLSMLTRRQNWCDNVKTPKPETCDEVLAASLETALDRLSAEYGDNMAEWHWRDAHQARFPHPVFTHVPWLSWLTDLSVPTGGDGATINRGAMRFNNPDAPFDHIHGPGYRAVYDLKNPHRSRFAIATGQSGNPLTMSYRDQLKAWSNGQYLRLGQTRSTLRELGAAVMRIEPKDAKGVAEK